MISESNYPVLNLLKLKGQLTLLGSLVFATPLSSCQGSGECGGLLLSSPLSYDGEIGSLRHQADEADLWIGAAVACPTLGNETAYSQTFATEFNYLTPENVLKWGHIHPTAQSWNVGDADGLLFYAKRHNMGVKGHALIWHEALPEYVNNSLEPDALQRLMLDHIQTLVSRYKGEIRVWDVVNEAIADDGTGFRHTLFYDKLGESFIGDAFEAAHRADPAALLYYNDYGAEDSGIKSQQVYDLVASLVEADVPIHGVGLQMHLNAATMPPLSEIKATMDRYGELGLRVSISEMDVRVAELDMSHEERLQQQGQIYRDITALCVEHYACRELSFWGFTDKYSWIDDFWGEDDPLLFDANYEAKAAYGGVLEGLSAGSP